MRFEWDASKNRRNVDKHGLDFADAPEAARTMRSTFADARREDGERCLVSLGEVRGTVVVVVWTERHTVEGEPVMRIISMRRANARERQAYRAKASPAPG